MQLLSKSCCINKDYTATLIGAADGMAVRKHNLKMNGLEKANKYNTDE